jgi:hypothetical protein
VFFHVADRLHLRHFRSEPEVWNSASALTAGFPSVAISLQVRSIQSAQPSRVPAFFFVRSGIVIRIDDEKAYCQFPLTVDSSCLLYIRRKPQALRHIRQTVSLAVGKAPGVFALESIMSRPALPPPKMNPREFEMDKTALLRALQVEIRRAWFRDVRG